MTNEVTKFNLKKLPFSPSVNPLVSEFTMTTRRKRVQTGGVRQLVDKHGEIHNALTPHRGEQARPWQLLSFAD